MARALRYIPQVLRFLEERTRTSPAEGSIDGGSGGSSALADTPPLPLTHYSDLLTSSPSLRALTRNPFLLRLLVDALPSLVATGAPLLSLTRYTIYEAFVRHWFTREVSRMSMEARLALGVGAEDGADDVSALVATMDLLCCLLAGHMMRIGSHVVAFPSSKGIGE